MSWPVHSYLYVSCVYNTPVACIQALSKQQPEDLRIHLVVPVEGKLERRRRRVKENSTAIEDCLHCPNEFESRMLSHFMRRFVPKDVSYFKTLIIEENLRNIHLILADSCFLLWGKLALFQTCM
jgi:hypothetical protein